MMLFAAGMPCQLLQHTCHATNDSRFTWSIAPPVRAVLRTKLTFVKLILAAENARRSGPGWLKFELSADRGSFSDVIDAACHWQLQLRLRGFRALCGVMLCESATVHRCTPTWQRWEEAVVVTGAAIAARGVVGKRAVRARQAAVSVGIDCATTAGRSIVEKCSIVQVQHAVLHPDHATCGCQRCRDPSVPRMQLRFNCFPCRLCSVSAMNRTRCRTTPCSGGNDRKTMIRAHRRQSAVHPGKRCR